MIHLVQSFRQDIGPAFETVKIAPHAAGKFQFYDLRLNNFHVPHRSFKDVSSLIFDGYFCNPFKRQENTWIMETRSSTSSCVGELSLLFKAMSFV